MTSAPTFTTWTKSTKSGGGDDCVEVSFADGLVGVRHSKDPTGPMLVYTQSEWDAFTGGVAAGELRGPACGPEGR